MIRVTPLMREGLLTAARAYAKAARVPLRRVSKVAYGKYTFFAGMSRGGNVSGEAYDNTMAWFENPEHWPHETIPPGALIDPFAAKGPPPCK